MKLSKNELRILKFNSMKRGMSEAEATAYVKNIIETVESTKKKVHVEKIKEKHENINDKFKDKFQELINEK